MKALTYISCVIAGVFGFIFLNFGLLQGFQLIMGLSEPHAAAVLIIAWIVIGFILLISWIFFDI